MLLVFLEFVSLYIEPGGTVRFLRVVIIWGHTTIVALVLSIDKMAFDPVFFSYQAYIPLVGLLNASWVQRVPVFINNGAGTGDINLVDVGDLILAYG